MNSTKKVKNIMIKSRKNAKSSKKNVNKKFFLAKLGYAFFLVFFETYILVKVYHNFKSTGRWYQPDK